MFGSRIKLLLVSFSIGVNGNNVTDPVSLVDIFHGSSGAGGIGGWASSEVPVGASIPFGLMKLGPDSTVCWLGIDFWWPYNHYGGYFYNDTCIRAFSHTKAQGTGLGDGGSLGIMVTRKPFKNQIIPQSSIRAPYMTNFSHTNETGKPGYYSVWLNDIQSLAEVTVSGSTSGIHRYTCYPSNSTIKNPNPCVIIADLCHSNDDGDCGHGSFTLSPSSYSNGIIMSSSFLEDGAFASDCGGIPIYTYLHISAIDTITGENLIPTSGIWADGRMNINATSANSTGKLSSLGAFFEFYPTSLSSTVIVTVRVGISFTSLIAAETNLIFEQGTIGSNLLSFEDAIIYSSNSWNKSLSSITINNIGYTDTDVLLHKEFLKTNEEEEFSYFFSKLHTLNGKVTEEKIEKGKEEAQKLAKAAACIWINSTRAGIDWLRTYMNSNNEKNACNNTLDCDSIKCEAALIYLTENAPSSTLNFAPTNGPLKNLGIPAIPHTIPPSRRLRSFYSSFYHALSGPTTYSDVNGLYIGLDNLQHVVTWRNGTGRRFSDFSLWDVYRSQTPLLNIVDKNASIDFLSSMVAMFNETNRTRIPHWVWGNCETNVMPGSHGLAIIADGLVKNVSGISSIDALAMAHAALDIQDLDDGYSTIGYIPFDAKEQSKAASLTLDYAFDDGMGAIIATIANSTSDFLMWQNRSFFYKNIFKNPNEGMCPRYANGSWPECPPLDLPPILLNNYYTEGDGAQYTFLVSHDLEGLHKLFQTDENYINLLQEIFLNTSYWPTNALPNPWYWAGNEPSVMMPWQFALVNSEAWRTQYWVRWALDVYYDDVPDGVPGNDDVGELNAWAVWATLGLYPITGTRTYILSSPCFQDVTINGGGGGGGEGGVLHIIAHNFTLENVFVMNASINGAFLTTPFVDHDDLFGGGGGEGEGLLEFWLSNVPYVWNGSPL
jgi:putative alpha-1,2-mannosidase